MIHVYGAHQAAHVSPDGIQVCDHCGTTLVQLEPKLCLNSVFIFFEPGAFVEKLGGVTSLVVAEAQSIELCNGRMADEYAEEMADLP